MIVDRSPGPDVHTIAHTLIRSSPNSRLRAKLAGFALEGKTAEQSRTRQ